MQIAQVMAGYSPGRRRPAAPGDGQEDRRGDGQGAAEVRSPAPRPTASTRRRPAKSLTFWRNSPTTASTSRHAAAYAVVSYQTAWLKANHPVEFMAGVMNCDLHLTDKLSIYAEEIRRGLGIDDRARPASTAPARPSRSRTGAILYALGALKNVGVEAMRLIVEARRGGATAVRHALRFRPAGRSEAAGQAAAGDAGPRRRLRRAGSEPRPGAGRRSTRWSPGRRRCTRTAPRRRCRCSARPARTCPSRGCRRSRTGCRPSG